MINRTHLGVRTAFGALGVLGTNLAHSQANFARMLWRFNKAYNADRPYADHHQPIQYELPLPPQLGHQLYVHTRAATARRNRSAAPGPRPT